MKKDEGIQKIVKIITEDFSDKIHTEDLSVSEIKDIATKIYQSYYMVETPALLPEKVEDIFDEFGVDLDYKQREEDESMSAFKHKVFDDLVFTFSERIVKENERNKNTLRKTLDLVESAETDNYMNMESSLESIVKDKLNTMVEKRVAKLRLFSDKN